MRVCDAFGFPAPRVPTPSATWPIPDCMVGLEFEYENPKGFPWQDWWQRGQPALQAYFNAVDDGSLRDGGLEFVLKEPLMGKDLEDSLHVLLDNPPPLAMTYRTSVHVHIDARDMSIEELKVAGLLYALTEAGMFMWIGGNRAESNYCVPWYESPEYTASRTKQLYGLGAMTKALMQNMSNGIARYQALNLNALRKHGTLEYRHMGEHYGIPHVTHWIKMCMAHKAAARSMTLREAERLILVGPEEVYTTVFGEQLGRELGRRVTEERHAACQFCGSLLVSFLASEESAVAFGKLVEEGGRNEVFYRAYRALEENR